MGIDTIREMDAKPPVGTPAGGVQNIMAPLPKTTPTTNPTPPAGPNMDDLYARNPGTVDVKPATKAKASLAEARDAEAALRKVKEAELMSAQMLKITSQDSPLMQRARQEGMMTAARRGLQNSSIAAGTAQGAMVDRAMPIAQGDAAANIQAAQANQDAQNAAALQNSSEANKISGLNASLKTDTSRFNSSMEQEANIQNAQMTNAMRAQVLQANADLNKQFLAGTQAMDLATIQGQYSQLISTNETAASMYNSYFNSIAQAMANPDISPDRIASYVQVQQAMLESGLRLMDTMNGLDFGDIDFQPPGSFDNAPAPIGAPPPPGGGPAPPPQWPQGGYIPPPGTIPNWGGNSQWTSPWQARPVPQPIA